MKLERKSASMYVVKVVPTAIKSPPEDPSAWIAVDMERFVLVDTVCVLGKPLVKERIATLENNMVNSLFE